MDAGECHFDSGTVGIRVADGSAVPSARRRIRTAMVFQAGQLRAPSASGVIYHICHLNGSGTPKARSDAAAKKGSSERRPVYRRRRSELLYQGLRLLVLQKPVQWDSFFGEIFSPVILVVLLLLVTCINCSDSESQERSQK